MTVDEYSKPVRLAALALRHAQADDWTKVHRVLTRLSQECGGEGVEVALRAWIDTYVAHSTGGDMMAARPRMTPINAQTGSTSTEGMPPRIAWAMRLVTARAALDVDAYEACLDELPNDEAVIGQHVLAVLECIALTINGLPDGYARMGRS